MNSSKSVLYTEHLGISFGGLKAVNDFNISIYESEIAGIIGPNGAGKTTVFNLITGVYAPSEGSVYICRKLMNGRKQHEFVQQGISRTFQNIRLFKKMTVLENVKAAMHNRYTYKFSDVVFRRPVYYEQELAADKEALNLLSIFELHGKTDKLASELPYGDMRKLEIARALAANVKILLLDEPACGMNPAEKAELAECINKVREKFNVAVLLIEHDMNFVMNMCKRIYVLDYGKTIACGTPQEIVSDKRVISAYLGG
ncbi:MAG: ABC transporter ATP-binding protein [Clostridia bacterium]|nr:ABC transporter ATP-binding protein [Clostridia bacterium]